MIDIPLFQDDEPLRFERIVFYPYPDLQRVWARLWLTAKQDTAPNVDITILNPDGSENTSIALLTQGEQRIEKTLHLRNPRPGATYRVVAELSVGVPGPEQAPVEQIERQEFEMPLEFRNPKRISRALAWGSIGQSGSASRKKIDSTKVHEGGKEKV